MLDKCIALIVHEPEVLQELCNIKFVDYHSNGFEIKVALRETEFGNKFCLRRHFNYPTGTEIVIESSYNDITDSLIQLLDILKLDLEDLLWVHPDINRNRFPSWELWRQDDNGQKFLIKIVTTFGKAQRLLKEFESSHHKQTYWIKRHEGG